MNQSAVFSANMFRTIRVLMCGVAFQIAQGVVHGQSYTFNDANSSATVNYTVGNQQGLDNWTVDGVNQMNQQSFWFQIGGGGPATNIGASPISVSTATTANSLDVTYNYSQFSFDVAYLLKGGTAGSGISDIAETITVNNTSGSALDLNIFQYTDLNLLNSGPGDSVTLYKSGRNNLFNEAYQTKGSLAMSDSINTPAAIHGEAAPMGTLLALLNGASFPILNDNATTGPTNATYALQWENVIASGGSYQISEDLNLAVVPEPSSSAMVLTGLITLGVIRRYAVKRGKNVSQFKRA